MTQIYQNLHQFSIYIPPLDFTIHQYLLASDPAILFAAGTVSQAEAVLPQLEGILKERELKYIFVSHMESDECGGISVFLKRYPNVKVICSPLCARELPGFGYRGEIIVADSKEKLCDGELDLQFFDYPAEVHLQDGVVCFEKNSGIFYSADLMFRYGNGVGETIQGAWHDEVTNINTERVPDIQRLELLQSKLLTIKPELVAVGHGFCVECEE